MKSFFDFFDSAYQQASPKGVHIDFVFYLILVSGISRLGSSDTLKQNAKIFP